MKITVSYRPARMWIWAGAGLLCESLLRGRAQAAEEAAAFASREIPGAGGPLIYVLGILVLLGLSLVIYLAASLRTSAMVPRDLMEHLFRTLDHQRLDEARALCRRRPSALATVAEAALASAQRTPDMPIETLEKIVENEGARQAGLMRNRIHYLLDIAVISPMVGLLGTVMGLLGAFHAVALDIVRAPPIMLAQGVSQALIATAAGLTVGLPAMVAHVAFRERAAGLDARLESAAAELVLRLSKPRGVQ